MAEKKATRAVYGEMLVELAEKYPELIVLDADLSSATLTKDFAKAYPDRFLVYQMPSGRFTCLPRGW